MFLFGNKRIRPYRTLSVRGPETPWERLVGVLKNRSVMGRSALCLLAVMVMLMVAPSWRPPFPYRQGDRITPGIAAQIDFSVVNEPETDRLQDNAEAQAPFVFVNDPTLLDPLPQNLHAALVALEQAETPAQLDEELRIAFGLAGGAGRESGESDQFALLKGAVSASGQIPAEERIAGFVRDFTKLIAPLRQTGIIDEEDVRRQGIRLDSPIRIVSLEEAPPAADAAALEQPAGDQLVRLPQVRLPSQLSEAGTLGDKWWLNYPSLTEVKPALKSWLGRATPPTLRFDQTATKEAKSAARLAVDQVVDYYSTGDLLVPPRTVLDTSHLALLAAEYSAVQGRVDWRSRFVRVIVVFIMLVALAVLNGYYLERNAPDLLRSYGRLMAYLCAIVATAALGRLMSFDPWRAEVIPLVSTVMVFAIAYNPVFAVLTGFTLSLILTLETTSQLSQFVVLMSTAAFAVLPLPRVSSRTTLIKAGFFAGLAYLLVSLGIGVLQSETVLDFSQDFGLIKQSLKGAAWCLFAGYLVAGSLPFIESAFGVVTDISLLEMSDPSHPLLQELVRRAPGTYNHSIAMASIAETAAESIGANGLLVRVGAYFHDIGKMLKPHYFIENVQAGTESRHEHLAPAMSTLIIIGHVKDGVDLAEQYNLPRPLIDFIEQHHGTTLVEYFYREATRQAGDSPDHRTDAEESSFRYPGPKPQSREAGVMMLADCVESASRTLTDPTPKRLETLVHELTMKRLLDGQFDESALTLSDIRTIEKSLVKSMIGIYHGRIKYPEARTA
jgi:hypothetical protein